MRMTLLVHILAGGLGLLAGYVALTFYLVITSLTTVRPLRSRSRWVDVAGMLMALAIALSCVVLGFRAIAIGGPEAGIALPLLVFGGFGLSARTTLRGALGGSEPHGNPVVRILSPQESNLR
jgi:hypothetical protein